MYAGNDLVNSFPGVVPCMFELRFHLCQSVSPQRRGVRILARTRRAVSRELTSAPSGVFNSCVRAATIRVTIALCSATISRVWDSQILRDGLRRAAASAKGSECVILLVPMLQRTER